MTQAWQQQRERGSPALIHLITWLTLHLGHRFGRAALYPITLYFVLFGGAAGRASSNYLQRVLGRRPRWSERFRHLHTFAITLLDRIFFLSGRHDRFDIRLHGEEVLFEQAARGGCLLLGSHLGSFEVLRTLALSESPLSIKALMYEENAAKVNAALGPLNRAVAETVIPIGGPDSLFRVQEAVAAGDCVGLLGDRLSLEDKQVACNFLGTTAPFPAGPVILASLLKVPVVVVFGLYRGGRRYDIHFELLADAITLERGPARMAQAAEWTQRYADRLEHYCRSAPYNWFNFYDFWAKESE